LELLIKAMFDIRRTGVATTVLAKASAAVRWANEGMITMDYLIRQKSEG